MTKAIVGAMDEPVCGIGGICDAGAVLGPAAVAVAYVGGLMPWHLRVWTTPFVCEQVEQQ